MQRTAVFKVWESFLHILYNSGTFRVHNKRKRWTAVSLKRTRPYRPCINWLIDYSTCIYRTINLQTQMCGTAFTFVCVCVCQRRQVCVRVRTHVCVWGRERERNRQREHWTREELQRKKKREVEQSALSEPVCEKNGTLFASTTRTPINNHERYKHGLMPQSWKPCGAARTFSVFFTHTKYC